MNDKQLIWENYHNRILIEKTEIVKFKKDNWSKYVIQDAMYIVRSAGLDPKHINNKLKFLAYNKSELIGVTFNSHRKIKEQQEDGKEITKAIYYFDIAVDPKHQGGTVGYLLTQACVNDAKSLKMPVLMYNDVVNPKMAQMLHKLFGFTFEHVDDGEGIPGHYNAHMEKEIPYP